MEWGQTFGCNPFVAMATSLPEVAVTLSALRISTLDMAIEDMAYTKRPLLANASTMHLISIQSAFMMTEIAIVGLLYRYPTDEF
jgi:cation:H+ antiporter